MQKQYSLNDIVIRNELRPGDIGKVVHLHGDLYAEEYGYGISFEAYVAQGLAEFVKQYDPTKDKVWVCEHDKRLIGFLVLMNRGTAAQLRYFILMPEYRGIGLGNQLMDSYMKSLKSFGYSQAFLLTTHEQEAAAHLYRKHGFKLSEEHDSSLFGKPLREQRYELMC